MIKTIEYKDANGSTQIAAYADRRTVYQLSAQREQFARLCAQGIDPLDAYCQAWGTEVRPDTLPQMKDKVYGLLHDTTVVLRIQELKRPVLRRLERKIEYTLNKALEQCQVAYDLAYYNGDVKGMLAAIRQQAELGKLLSQDINVNHKYGVLDDASTEVLLELRKQIEVRRAKQKGNVKLIEVNSRMESAEPQAPSLESLIGSHPEAVPN